MLKGGECREGQTDTVCRTGMETRGEECMEGQTDTMSGDGAEGGRVQGGRDGHRAWRGRAWRDRQTDTRLRTVLKGGECMEGQTDTMSGDGAEGGRVQGGTDGHRVWDWDGDTGGRTACLEGEGMVGQTDRHGAGDSAEWERVHGGTDGQRAWHGDGAMGGTDGHHARQRDGATGREGTEGQMDTMHADGPGPPGGRGGGPWVDPDPQSKGGGGTSSCPSAAHV